MNKTTSVNLTRSRLTSAVQSAGLNIQGNASQGNTPWTAPWRHRSGAVMLATILFALLATNAMASLIAYEPYNYTLATAPTFVSGTPTQTTGGGFSSGYNGGGLTTVAGLTYSGLSTAYNALKQTAAYSGENLSSPVSSGTVYISYVFNMSGNPGGNKVGLEMNTGGNGMFVGVTTPVTGTTGKLGVNQQVGYNDGAATQWESSTANITYGSTYFVVVKLTGTGSGWAGSIWVNPTANTSSEPAPDGTFTMPQFTISACSIVNPAGAGGNFLFDELRLGTTWAEAVTYTVPAPSAPTGLAATAGGNSVVLNWTAAAGSPVSYNVKRSTTSGSGYVTVSPAGAVTDTSFTNSVVGGVTYYYVVSAVNSGGESADSSEVSAAPTLVAPDAPTGLAASASDGQVVLSWAGGIASSGYNVKRSTTSGAEVTIATSGATSYTDFTVVNGTTYYYAVSATNSVGESANSAEVTASPVAYQPVYESFNYGLGSFATGTASTANGLTGNWTVGNGTIIAGLTYTGLPVSHNAIATTGSRDVVSLSSSLSSGTKYISFLFNQVGNNGGNLNGIFFPGSGATSLIVGLTAPYSGTAGSLGLGSVTTAGAGATGISTFSGLQVTGGFNYSQTHLIVLEIDFNTSGDSDTVSLWLDPPAGTNAPPGAANLVWSTYDVGTISGIGFNTQGGGNADQFDEIRTGNTYGSVVGAAASATPTTLTLSVGSGNQISWSAQSTNFYQPQSSTDNSTWTDLGGLLTGAAVTSVFDPAPGAAFYQVLEITPVTTEAAVNGDFEIDDGGAGAQSWSSVQSQPPVRITTDFHTGAACMDLAVTNETAGANGAEIQQNVVNQGGSIIAGNTYVLSFWAKQISSGVSYVQNYKITWLDNATPISSVGFTPFTGGSGTWAQISTGPIVAPANATSAFIQIFGATGAVQDGSGEVLIDDLSLTTTTATGTPTVIPSTVQSGAVFTSSVQTNGVTAADATGSVAFTINNVPQSTGSVTGGTANSTPTAVPASYTVTAIYSGDGIYGSSTNTLVVGSGVNTTPTNIVTSVSGNQLTLAWPADHTGWTLQSQTNTLNAGLGSNWTTVSGSTTTNQMTFTIDPANPAVFYRLKY